MKKIAAILLLLVLVLGLTACAPSPNAALKENAAVAELEDLLHDITIDDLIGNGVEDEAWEGMEYQGLFDALPREGFSVQEPYILFANIIDAETEDGGPAYYDILSSEGGKVDAAAVEKAQMLIYAQFTYDGEMAYAPEGSAQDKSFVRTYAVELYYYDVASKTIVGLEEIASPGFPEEVSGTTSELKPSDEEIMAAVAARAAE